MKNGFLTIIILSQVFCIISKAEDEKINLDQLEKKYWSEKDDDFSVVQNRSFTKSNRFFLNASLSNPINDPYSKGSSQDLIFGYFFSELMGFEFAHSTASYKFNEATSQFMDDHGTIPNHNTLKGFENISFVYSPLYAKMSFLNKKIIYFDFAISAGIGTTKYSSNISTGNKELSASNYNLTLSQHYYISENFDLRFDYRNVWTNEERYRYKINPGESETARSLGNKLVNDTQILIGLTYWK